MRPLRKDGLWQDYPAQAIEQATAPPWLMCIIVVVVGAVITMFKRCILCVFLVFKRCVLCAFPVMVLSVTRRVGWFVHTL